MKTFQVAGILMVFVPGARTRRWALFCGAWSEPVRLPSRTFQF
jgi:hypothetical protein